jgi:hypothetical protein
MLHVSVMCDHHQVCKTLKCVSTYVIGLFVYNGSNADSPVLHNRFQDYSIIEYIELIIKLGKAIIYFHYYSY